MKNTVFLVVSAVVYISAIVLIALKIRDIVKYPDKYKHEELVAQGDKLVATKKYHIPFKSLSHQYGTVGLLFTLILTAIEALVLYGLQRWIFVNGSVIMFGTSVIGVICLFFLNIFIGMNVIPLAIKKPFFEVSTRDLFNVTGRNETYKRTYILLLITFIIVFPFTILGTNNYAYYNENGITYSKFFQLNETSIDYNDIETVKVNIHHDNSGNVDVFEYIIIYDGKEVNLNNPNTSVKGFTEEVFEIHKYIESKGSSAIEITPLNTVDCEYIADKLNDRQRQIVNYIFEGFHNG